MIIEIVFCLYDDQISGLKANKMHLKTHCSVLQTKITGFSSYIVSHCIVLYDVNITIWPLGRSIIAEFTRGFP